MRVQVLRPPENPDENKLARRVSVQTPRDQKVGQRDPVSCLLPDGLEGGEGGRGDCATDVDVCDGCKDQVVACGGELERVGGFHGVLGAAHFGDEDEEPMRWIEC